MTVHHVDVYEDQAGTWRWKVTNPSQDLEHEVVAESPEDGFKTKPEALTSMFSIFFGDYDESFLTLYAEWNPLDGVAPNDKHDSESVAVGLSQEPQQQQQRQPELWSDSDSVS